MRSRSPARRRGFTLVELMLAIAVIGILSTVAQAAYSSYMLRVRNAQAIRDITVMSVAIKDYAGDHSGQFPSTLADVSMSGAVDPWGRPYQYYNIAANGKGHARKDHALNPLNSDFDLYSVGPDGVSKSQITQKDSLDDVIRASDGAFIDQASKF